MSDGKYAVRNVHGYTEHIDLDCIRSLVGMGEGHNFTLLDPRYGGKTIGEVFSADGSIMYDRGARTDHEPSGASGYANLRDGTGHGTQYYEDGYRLSRDTDGVGDSEVHWTDQRVGKGWRRFGRRHTPPPDAR